MATSLAVLDLLETEAIAEDWIEMAKMVTGIELRHAVEQQTFIQGGDPRCAEGVKYDFRLSSRILKAKWGQPVDMDNMPKEDLFIQPGEVVFVLSQERLNLSSDMIAILSPKRKLSHEGILSTGGLFIDPGYQGRLLVGLYNFSSSPWPIIAGKKLIAATFYRLVDTEQGDFPAPPPALDEFPDELVKVIREYEPVAVQAVSSGLESLRTLVTQLQDKILTGEGWVQRFQGNFDATNQQIYRLTQEVGEVSRDLLAETENRRQGQDSLTRTVGELNQSLSYAKGAMRAVSWIVGIGTTIIVSVVAGLALAIVKGWLHVP
jgi:deoxycytidine triphosphate deaminase